MKAKRKILIAVVLYGIGIASLAGTAVYPIWKGVSQDYAKVLVHKQEILQLQTDKKNSHEFEVFLAQHSQELNRTQDLFVASKTPIAFSRFLDELAASSRLRIQKTAGSIQQTSGDRWPSFTFRLAGQGRYLDAMVFLQKIENAPYLLQVQSFSFSSRQPSQEEEKGKVEFSISLKVFTK